MTAPSPPAARTAPITCLLYLHGFRSSPQSFKARLMAAWMQAHRPDVVWWCPPLPASPREAMALLMNGTAGWPEATSAVIGSSLGGYYATAWAEAHPAARCVVLNPAVDPARDLAGHLGTQPMWHDPTQTVDVKPEFGDELRAMQVANLTRPERYFAVIAKGDEVLDWREMQQRYAVVRTRLLDGGDHALSDFEQQLPEVLDFLALR